METPPTRPPLVRSPPVADGAGAQPAAEQLSESPFANAECRYMIVRTDGDSVSYSAKATQLPGCLREGGPQTFWELRGWTDFLAFDGKTWKLSVWVQGNMVQWKAWWRSLRLQPFDFITSQKSKDSPTRGGQWCFNRCGNVAHAKEFVLATAFLIGWLLCCGMNIRSLDRRARADTMLRELLLRCGIEEDHSFLEMPLNEECDEGKGSSPGAPCVHAVRLQRLLQQQGVYGTSVAGYLARMPKEAVCPFIARRLADLVARVAARIDEYVFTESSWPTCPFGLPVIRGRTRARRIDEVVSRSVAIDVVREKRSRSSIQCVKATKMMAPSTASSQIQASTANYMWTGNRNFVGESQLSLTYDASCIAGKETLAIGIYSARKHLCMRLPPQVMPSLRAKGRAATQSAKGIKKAKADWRSDLRALLHQHNIKSAAKQVRKAMAKQRETRGGARDALLAIDHALQFVASGLQSFYQEPEARTRPLARYDTRYMIKDRRGSAEPLPDGVEKQRMRVKDSRTEQKRYEVLEYTLQQPALTLAADEGPKEYPLLWFLAARGFRTVWLPDPLHRVPRDLENAAKESDNWAMVLGMTFILNLNIGPFKSRAWFSSFYEGLEDYIRVADSNGPLFVELYGPIAADQRVDARCIGTEEHYKQLFKNLEVDKMLQTVGSAVKWTRWSSFDANMAKFFGIWHSKSLVLSAIALRMELVRDVTDMSFWSGSANSKAEGNSAGAGRALARQAGASSSSSGAASSASTAAPAASAGAAASSISAPSGGSGTPAATPAGCRRRMPQKQSANMDEKRGKCMHSTMVAMDILSDETLHRKAKYWHTLSTPVWEAHREEYKSLTGPAEVVKMYSSWARGDGLQALVTVWQKLFDLQALTECGFVMTNADQTTRTKTLDSEDPLYMQEATLAREVFKTTVCIIRHRAMSMAHYMFGFPGCMVLLLSDHAGDRQRGWGICKEAWTVITSLEERRLKSVDAEGLFDSICFCKWIVIREILVFLAEVSFACAPGRAKSMLEGIFHGFGTSLPCEIFFNRARYGQDQQNGPKLTSLGRWSSAVVRKSMEQFQRPEIVGSSADRGDVAAAVPESMFDPRRGTPTVPKKDIEAICKRPDWQSYSPQSKRIMLVGWALAKAAAASGEWDDIGSAWKTLLLQPMDIARVKPSTQCVLILYSCKYGALGWPIAGAKISGKVQWTVALQCELTWIFVTKEAKAEVWTLELVPPIARIATDGPQGIGIMTKPKATPALERAARMGFKGLTDFYIQQLLRERGVLDEMTRDEKPKTVVERVVALIRSVIPGATEQEINEMVLERCPTVESSCKVAKNLDVAEGVMDPTDKAAVKASAEKITDDAPGSPSH